MAEIDEQDEGGMSTPKKVVAGAALGVAVPAAVGVARKLMSGGSDDSEGDDEEQGQEDDDDASSEPTSRGARSTTQRRKPRTTSRPKTRSRPKTASRSKTASRPKTTSNRTREQLYRTATRLRIAGPSSINKQQLERAIARAKNK